MTNQDPPGSIEALNGSQIYFEVKGTGEPLLLLHGFTGLSQDWKIYWHPNGRQISA
jgi:pimeloyl-ACP methyl ester carboxylesterase